MMRYIFKNWWRRKDQFMLLMIGVIIVGVGLTYLAGLSEVNKSTIVDELQERWKSSYDIVVRPNGTRSVTEEDDLLDPNFLSGIEGGISIEDYNKIKNIDHVEVAAPIAMMGYINYPLPLDTLDMEKDGIYRLTKVEVTDDGISKKEDSISSYFPAGEWFNYVEDQLREKGPDYFIIPYPGLTVFRSMLIAGIDPEQEAKLVGLDKSILPFESSRYLSEEDETNQRPVYEADDIDDAAMPKNTSFPAIINSQSYADKRVNYKIERLDIPFEHDKAKETLDMMAEKGGSAYLDTVQGETIESFNFEEQDIYAQLINGISGVNHETGEPISQSNTHIENPLNTSYYALINRPSSLEYESIDSPFSERWPFSYQLKTFTKTIQGSEEQASEPETIEVYRNPNEYAHINAGDFPLIEPKWVGSYDPGKLNISKDPTNELPMETYRPTTAELVLDDDDRPINPTETLKPTYDPYNFLSNPPTMLTTLEAAEVITGDAPISAIRIKVSGVTDLSEESQAIVEQVVSDIERETGLITDVTLGSSPQPTLVNVPSVNDGQELGWFYQPWIKMGSSITIFREARVGFSGLVISIMAVAIIYVWATSLVSLLARRKEFAVLLAVGWRPSRLSRLLFLESAMLGVCVAALSWGILAFLHMSGQTTVDLMRFLLTGSLGFVIYLLGAIIPAIIAQRISPYETMQTGEIAKSSARLIRTKGLMSMAFNHFIGKWKRSVLSIVAIAFPSSLLAVFLLITFHLRGIMYTTLLGQYVALEVESIHYAAIGAALLLAILTTVEIMWQNIAERQEEIALLKAVGWKNNSVRFLIWLEGLLVGVCAAILGLAGATLLTLPLELNMSTDAIMLILSTALVPIVVGVLATILPAERAARILPQQGISGRYTHRKASVNLLVWSIFLGVILLIAFMYTMVQAVQV
ncbi:ABC transporter permease [Lentibacillus saliphilus]|uniref:ABC transporter permease n=1 Tax=Lentibacillus saliphilus TaxID=2737028 RepID=UPI001C3089C4|nr:FtsX-like permease family protein [Lentibacillus saliphilus]